MPQDWNTKKAYFIGKKAYFLKTSDKECMFASTQPLKREKGGTQGDATWFVKAIPKSNPSFAGESKIWQSNRIVFPK